MLLLFYQYALVNKTPIFFIRFEIRDLTFLDPFTMHVNLN